MFCLWVFLCEYKVDILKSVHMNTEQLQEDNQTKLSYVQLWWSWKIPVFKIKRNQTNLSYAQLR